MLSGQCGHVGWLGSGKFMFNFLNIIASFRKMTAPFHSSTHSRRGPEPPLPQYRVGCLSWITAVLVWGRGSLAGVSTRIFNAYDDAPLPSSIQNLAHFRK